MTKEEALKQIAALHSDSGYKTQHWCAQTGEMEDNHGYNDTNQCEECGPQSSWPCETYKLAAGLR
jgi:hypothetical protein